MAEANETQAKQAEPRRNKDGYVPGQRLTPKDLAAYRNKKRKIKK